MVCLCKHHFNESRITIMYKTTTLIIISFIFCFQACELEDNSLHGVGTDSVLVNELLPAAIIQLAYNRSAIGGRSAAHIMQYLQAFDPCSPSAQYYFPPSHLDNMWSSGFYTGSLSSIREIQKLAEEENANDIKAISLILSAHEFQSLTCMFGDIPFSQALEGRSIEKPKYDTQKEVYDGIVEMLDEAILLLGDKVSNDELFENDPIYQGNLVSWKKFAFGLKARSLFNQRNQNENLDTEILLAISNSFTSSEDQASLGYSFSFNNPQYTFEDWRPSNQFPGEFLVSKLIETDDPRFTSFFYPGGSSYLSNWNHFDKDGFISNWFDQYDIIPILSYTELLFMKTELSLNIGLQKDDISLLLEEAIRSSMKDNNIDLVDSTLTFINTYSSLNGLNEEQILEKIIDQAYVAYFGNNHLQSWTNFRRTGYPTILSQAIEPNEFNPTQIVPRRFMYPSSEIDNNSENLEEAIVRQGGNLLDTEMWMFK